MLKRPNAQTLNLMSNAHQEPVWTWTFRHERIWLGGARATLDENQPHTKSEQKLYRCETESVPERESGTVPYLELGTVPYLESGTVPYLESGTVPYLESGSVPDMSPITVESSYDTGTDGVPALAFRP
jgi:hypothetical protein